MANDQLRGSSQNEVVSLLSMMMQNVIETITTTQRQSLEMQTKAMEQLRAMTDSIKIIVDHASADPSRAKVLIELTGAIEKAFREHDTNCSTRASKEITNHQNQMERIIEFKSENAEHLFEQLKIILSNGIEKIDKTKEEFEKTLDNLDKAAEWVKTVVKVGGPALIAVCAAAIAAGFWIQGKIDKVMEAVAQVTK